MRSAARKPSAHDYTDTTNDAGMTYPKPLSPSSVWMSWLP